MAIAAVSEVETQLCENCQKDIPAVNFIIHEIHCSRNIEVCCYCRESVPKSEMKKHIESEHVQVTCKCRMKMESSLLKDHEASACPLRPALCRYCGILLPFRKLQDHEVYCGARTEACAHCGRNVLLRDLEEHPRVCGQEEKLVRGRRGAVLPSEDEDGGLHTLGDSRSQLRSGEDGLEQWERDGKVLPSPSEEWSADLDYVLALSLQQEADPEHAAAEVPSAFWEYCCTKGSGPPACLQERGKSNSLSSDSLLALSTSNPRKSDEIIMLPCEFCEELCPAEDLILHQTGCNPASAFASFSKRSSPKPPEDDGLCAVGSKGCRFLSSSQPPAGQAEGDIVIPCEFCGIQLEEETIFHHQHHCELRPASPPAGLPPPQLLPPRANQERRDSASPELPPRRPRHQGDVSPWCREGFGEQRLSCPAGGTRSLSTMANTGKTALCSSARASNAPDSGGKPRNAAGSEGRAKKGSAGGAAAGTTHVRPAQNFHPEAFTASFLRTSPGQPSSSSGRGRSLGRLEAAVSSRGRSTQVKVQSPASSQPEE